MSYDDHDSDKLLIKAIQSLNPENPGSDNCRYSVNSDSDKEIP